MRSYLGSGKSMQFNVKNNSADPITVAGVSIDPGETRDLFADGATIEDITQSESLAAGLTNGDLTGPPQLMPVTETSDGLVLEPGASIMVSPDTVDPFSVVLPSAATACRVPFGVMVSNQSSFDVTVSTGGSDTMTPAGGSTVPPGVTREFLSSQDGGGAWGWVAT